MCGGCWEEVAKLGQYRVVTSQAQCLFLRTGSSVHNQMLISGRCHTCPYLRHPCWLHLQPGIKGPHINTKHANPGAVCTHL